MKNRETIIKIESLTKVFRVGFFRKKVKAVNDLSLEVYRGEIFGFLGPNGAGKTTSIKILMGLLFPTSGRATLFGYSPFDIRAKSKIGFLPENPYFYEYLTGYEFLEFYATLFGLPRSIRSARVERLLEQVGLSHAKNLPLRKYSKGMIQRIGIAQALINDPDLVVLDEPMSGLDPIGRKEVRDIIFQLKEQGKTVFFSSHILQDVEMICDRVAILIKGQLRKIGVLSELLSEQTGYKYELSASKLSPTTAGHLKNMAEKVLVPGPDRVTVVIPQKKVEEALQLILREKGQLESLQPIKGTLEDLFVEQVRSANQIAEK